MVMFRPVVYVVLAVALLISASDAQISSLFGATPSSMEEGSSGDTDSSTYAASPRSLTSDGFYDPFGSHTSDPPRRSPITALETPAAPRSYRAHLRYSSHTRSGWEYITTTKTVRWTPSRENVHVVSSSSTGHNGYAIGFVTIVGIIVVLSVGTCCVVGCAFLCSKAREHKLSIGSLNKSVRRKLSRTSTSFSPVNTEEL